MKKIKFLYICIAFALIVGILTANKTVENTDGLEIKIEESSKPSEWDMFIEAIIWKESRGNENCVGDNGKAVGVLQIHPIMVREANRILKLSGVEKEYTYDDRYDRTKSIEIFKIVQDYHNKSHDFNRALQIWNKNHPVSYKTQIMNKYNELISA